MLEFLVNVAQLATLLLIPAVIYAARILSHVQRVELFMKETADRVARIEGRQAELVTDVEILKDRADREPVTG